MVRWNSHCQDHPQVLCVSSYYNPILARMSRLPFPQDGCVTPTPTSAPRYHLPLLYPVTLIFSVKMALGIQFGSTGVNPISVDMCGVPLFRCWKWFGTYLQHRWYGWSVGVWASVMKGVCRLDSMPNLCGVLAHLMTEMSSA